MIEDPPASMTGREKYIPLYHEKVVQVGNPTNINKRYHSFNLDHILYVWLAAGAVHAIHHWPQISSTLEKYISKF